MKTKFNADDSGELVNLSEPSSVGRQESSILVSPAYLHPPIFPLRPKNADVLADWLDAVAFWKNPSRTLIAFYALHHLATFICLVFFLRYHFSLLAVASILLMAFGIVSVYNTVWYHRYCSHQAFKFRNIWWARIFLWTNPVCFREECYVIPHRVHHAASDGPGDPYGPHLGWLGTYLAAETAQKLNPNISQRDYDRVSQSLVHIGFRRNSYADFQKTGSIENVPHYFLRLLVSHLFWSLVTYAIAGWTGVLAFFSSVFVFNFLLRDFNYRGHEIAPGPGKTGVPLNQMFYGIIAGEWHKNHHLAPKNAKSGRGPWQLDFPWYMIKAMYFLGIVTHYNRQTNKAGAQ